MNGWIDIKDEVPKPNRYVIVCFRWNSFINIMQLQYDSKYKEYKWTDWCYDPVSFETVTHWMELPLQPDGKKSPF